MTGGGGKSALGFLNLKSFHPSNKANQRKLWMAEQKQKDDIKREKERKIELEREQELAKNKQLMAVKKIDKVNAKAQREMSFMYAPPPGFKKEMPEDEQDELKKKSRAEEDVEKFPFLKDAPVQGQYTDNIQVHHKPFGIELRNVKCARCHQWGHQSGDRECPLKNVMNPNDAERQKMEDPLMHNPSLFEKDITGNNDGLVLKRNCLSPINRGIAENQQMIAEEPEPEQVNSDEDDIEKEFLASLTRKQRKLLLKEFKREERKHKKKHKEKKTKKEQRKD